MKTKLKTLVGISFCIGGMLILTQCAQAPNEGDHSHKDSVEAKPNYGGYESEVKYGEHLVMIAGCGDCHTPKKMTEMGPELDSTMNMSGHPSAMPIPPVNRKEMETKGVIATQTLTAWIGPWGVSYSANISSDPTTGIGNWTFENFLTAIRQGKSKGVVANRPLMPPMPWQVYSKLSDDELKAIFAYLKSTNPISNKVPEYQPPVSPPPAHP